MFALLVVVPYKLQAITTNVKRFRKDFSVSRPAHASPPFLPPGGIFFASRAPWKKNILRSPDHLASPAWETPRGFEGGQDFLLFDGDWDCSIDGKTRFWPAGRRNKSQNGVVIGFAGTGFCFR